jgi:CSLREA domain-containing protein
MSQCAESMLVRSMRAALAISALSLSAQAHTATLTVNTTIDASPPAGTCSLRKAIDNANSNATIHPECQPVGAYGADLIVFDPTIFPPDKLTYSFITGGQLLLSDQNLTTIDGGGAVILDSQGYGKRFFNNAGTSYLHSLRLYSGDAGAGNLGGAIYNSPSGHLTTSNCFFTANVANHGGGAIYNAGYLKVTQSAFSSNYVANGYGGAIAAGGLSAVHASSTTIVTSSFFNKNGSYQLGTNDFNTRRGGAISVIGGTLHVSGSSFTNNKAGRGGAIFAGGNDGFFTLTDSTLSGNATKCDSCGYTGTGGAIHIGGGSYNTPATVGIENVTISGNTAPIGGGIYNGQYSIITLSSATISGNSAQSPGSNINSGATGSQVLLSDTIIANGQGASNCTGTLVDSGGNIDDGSSCGLSMATGSLPNTSPQLVFVIPLNNGGPTFTFALESTSPALRLGINCPAADQRGFSRPATHCDSGAFEETLFFSSLEGN